MMNIEFDDLRCCPRCGDKLNDDLKPLQNEDIIHGGGPIYAISFNPPREVIGKSCNKCGWSIDKK